jgi:histone deacetylase 11
LGWTVNLSGGFHHASFSNGGGFCIYPDISLAVHYLKTRKNIVKVMIIDLDAHQGNGHERDHIGDENVFIADFYNHYIYPDDQIAMKAIKRDVGVLPQTTDQEYLQSMKILEQDIDSFCPGFVIYNAGTDIL